ncbi:HAD family hydrolase [Chloroflexota bacterium]
MVKAVFFDFFNTLSRYEQSRENVYIDVCAKYGKKVDLKALIMAYPEADKYLRDQLRLKPASKRSKINQINLYMKHATILLREADVNINKIIAFHIVMGWLKFKWDFIPFEDTLDILKYCKEKAVIVGIISNIDRDMLDISEKMGMSPYVDFYVTSHEAGCEKPAPGIFNLALQKASIKPEEAIYVGDQYDSDVVGARGVGINPILLDRNNLFAEITDCPRIINLLELKNYLQ